MRGVTPTSVRRGGDLDDVSAAEWLPGLSSVCVCESVSERERERERSVDVYRAPLANDLWC